MGVSSTVASVLLCIINSIVLLVAIILFGIGVAIVSGYDVFITVLDKLEQEYLDAAAACGVTGVNTSNMTLAALVVPAGWILIIFSILVGIMCILGYVGAYCRIKIILIAYAVILSILIFVQVLNVIIFAAYPDAYGETVKPYLRQYTLQDYAGIEGTDSNSLIWNSLMVHFDCCGIDDYTDFSQLANWPPATVNGASVNLEVPILCCKSYSTDYACATVGTSTTTNSWRAQGCYEEIHDEVTTNAVYLTGFILVLLIQGGCLVLAIIMICTMDNIII